MAKKLTVLFLAAITMLGVFGFAGCDNENIKTRDILKQGVYSTDDDMFRIELYGENSFSLHIMFMSHLPTGSYNVDKEKLMLNYTNDRELVFDIGDNRLTFLGTNAGGQFAKEGLIIVGSVFNLTFYEKSLDDMIELHLVPTSVDITLFSILLNHTEENAEFECAVDNGNFFLLTGENVEKKINLVGCGRINWRPMEKNVDGKIVPIQIEQAFVDIIIKIDGNITGYAVIKFLQDNKPFHTGSILKSAIFPKINGEYQNISKEYIIEKMKSYELKKGVYVTDDGFARVTLNDNNKFVFDRGGGTSYRPLGSYYIKTGKLILHVIDDEEYIFEIKKDYIVFLGMNFAGSFFADETTNGPVKPGVIFRLAD